MNVEEYKTLAKPKKKPKYRNREVIVDGIKFASKREAEYYGTYKNLLHGGEIHDLEVHPVFKIVINGVKIGRYTADFAYRDKHGEYHVIDVKSPSTAEATAFRLRKRIVEALYPHVKVEIVK